MKKCLFLAYAILAILGCADIDMDRLPCVTCSSCPNPVVSNNSVTCGGQTYRTVNIGSQIWMAENLNYNPSSGNSDCYDNQESNCTTYGRLYDWWTALAVCPYGWHLPSNEEWDVLLSYVKNNSGNGTDDYGPGGFGYSGRYLVSAGCGSGWWSATEGNGSGAYGNNMGYSYNYENYKDRDYSYKLCLVSVRCVQDGSSSVPVLSSSAPSSSSLASSSSSSDSVSWCVDSYYEECTNDPYYLTPQACAGWNGVLQGYCPPGYDRDDYGGNSSSSSSGGNLSSSSSSIPSSSSQGPNITGILAFKNADYSSSGVYFFVGTNVTIENNINSTIAVSNADADCGEVSIELSGCDAPGEVYTTTTNCTITAKAVATCEGTRRELKTATAEVVPDPYLNGSCAWDSKWDSKNDAFFSGVSAKVVTAPTIQNAYGRCEGPYFLVGGEQRQNVSVGLTVDEWSGNAMQKMSEITIGATCTGKAMATIACPIITVRDPDAILQDSRDNQSYQTVVIGTQIWMAENLNYETSDSKCYNNYSTYCNIYGRLYDWSSAMGLPSSCNSITCSSQIQTPHRGICPKDWHIPSQAEWNTLSSYVQSNSGCSSCDAAKLKAISFNGTDDYGFSALLGGSYSNDIGVYGYWWSASENSNSGVYSIYMFYSYAYTNYYSSRSKSTLVSVRCVKD